MENAEAKGVPDTDCTRHQCLETFTVENHTPLRVNCKKMLFEIIKLFQIYEKNIVIPQILLKKKKKRKKNDR